MELVSILIFVLPLALLWLFLVVPQQRRVREQRELINRLEPGDEVMTTAGIYGKIVELSDDNMYLQVAPGVELRFARGAVARKITGTNQDTEPLDEPDVDESPATTDEAGDDR